MARIGHAAKAFFQYILYGVAIMLGFLLAFLSTHSGKSHGQFLGEGLTIGDTAHADAPAAGGIGGGGESMGGEGAGTASCSACGTDGSGCACSGGCACGADE